MNEPEWDEEVDRWGRLICSCCRLTPVVIVARNGVRQLIGVCVRCDRKGNPSKEMRDLWRGHLDELPVIDDNRERYVTDAACERCGSVDVEYHHWAPRALFDDADNWPGAYLCPQCHREWHRKVTPYLSTLTRHRLI